MKMPRTIPQSPSVLAAPLALVALALTLAACSGAGSTSAGGPPGAGSPPQDVPVTIAAAAKRDVPVEIVAVGTVQPPSTVEVRAQVGGVLTRVAFKEGQDVRKGDLLFTIDQRPHEATLQQAQAALDRDTIRAKQSASEVPRYRDLVAKDYVTAEQFDRIQSEASAADAIVAADRAAVENARLQLGYCSIRSPMDARAGQIMVHEGNVVKDNDATLVVLLRVVPIEVRFFVPQQRLDEIRRYREEGTLAVVAGPPGSSNPSAGELTFIDNAVDSKTGTILLKATFPNKDRALWPGEFVEARLRLATREGALTVPAEAVLTGQQGTYVWVVKPDGTAESRPVVTDGVAGADAVVAKGLSDGETVVTDGQLRLMPGAKVSVRGGSGAPGATGGAPPAGRTIGAADGTSDGSGAGAAAHAESSR